MKKQLQAGSRFALALAVTLAVSAGASAQSPEQEARAALDAFNQRFIAACQSMDNPAAAELWADDGADLLPGMAPMVGKAKISAWLNSLAPQAGTRMVYCTVDWQDIQIHGDLAYEWGINRQKVEFPAPKPPFVGEGKIVLVLKRQKDGQWKIALESWNNSPPPPAS